MAARRGDLLAGEANSYAAAANTASGADGDAGAGHAVDVGAVHVADHLAVVSQARAAIADDATSRREAQALQVDDLVGRQVAVEAAGGVGVTIAVEGVDGPEAVVAVLAVDVAAGLLRDQPLVDGAQAERTLDAGQDGVELVEDVLNLVHHGAQATRRSSAGGHTGTDSGAEGGEGRTDRRQRGTDGVQHGAEGRAPRLRRRRGRAARARAGRTGARRRARNTRRLGGRRRPAGGGEGREQAREDAAWTAEGDATHGVLGVAVRCHPADNSGRAQTRRGRHVGQQAAEG